MSLHKEWVKAKKDAQTQFKEAEKNFLKKQDKAIKAKDEGTAKARVKHLEAALDEAGLGMKESLSDYLKFADGFGDTLDNLEDVINKNDKLSTKYDLTGSASQFLANKALAKPFLEYCQRSQNTNLITFYASDYKKTPEDIYEEYIKDGAKKQIDFSANKPLATRWQNAKRDPTVWKTDARQLVNDTKDHVEDEITHDLLPTCVNDAKFLKTLGFVPKAEISALKQAVKDTAAKYKTQIDSAKKRWKNHTPQFWKPLEDCLQSIHTYCTKN